MDAVTAKSGALRAVAKRPLTQIRKAETGKRPRWSERRVVNLEQTPRRAQGAVVLPSVAMALLVKEASQSRDLNLQYLVRALTRAIPTLPNWRITTPTLHHENSAVGHKKLIATRLPEPIGAY